ncbi:uncharacterized protein EV154DRAFT_508961 [Mucor mucedo]|uniref:uncharacterized protein n=1 Tax=Mucor mucedo TaxID=29922 RepID=UPI0022210820|nr:uncharacterized protein EV154DRAFT_508961 [Mucor mucedo]KAI7891192.1 hypothetical protein EV154DRAFT_508961 [Mucor mucedo]
MSKEEQKIEKANANLTASAQDNSADRCYPSCQSRQTCVSIWGCDNCLVWKCFENRAQLQAATEFHTGDNGKRTILIAVLATGLACIVACTIGAFVLYKRRRLPKPSSYHDADEKYFSIEPLTPIQPAILPPIWTHQCDPFIIGAQSLQIPRLDDTPGPLMNRSASIYNIPSITHIDSSPSFQCTKPTLVRIDTIIKKDDCDLNRETSIKTPNDSSSSKATDFLYLCPPPHNEQEHTPASSSSTLGDGSITVFFESPRF